MNNKINGTENLSRREREKAAHRQEILDAAVKVFAEKGFHSATLDEIAQKAEFSKATIYLYFSNKEDLLYNVLYEAFERMTGYGREIYSEKVSFRDGLNALLNRVAEEIFNNLDLFTLVSTEHASFFLTISEKNRNEFIKKHDDAWKNFEGIVAVAIENGELRDIPPQAITGMIHGSMDAMVTNQWHCKTLDELKKAIPIFMNILFNGIAKKKETKP